MAKFFYDVPFVKEIIGYLLIPVLILIIISSIIILIYSSKYKDHENPIYKYKINLASLLISTFLVIVFLAVLIGFAIAFKNQIDANNIKTILSYVVIASPIIPLLALIFLFIKIVLLVKNKPNKNDINKFEDKENLDLMIEDSIIEKDDKKEEVKEEHKQDDEIELL